MRGGGFIIWILVLQASHLKAFDSFNTQGFFNTGVAFSTTKWLYDEDKLGITNKPSFQPLTNIGLMVQTYLLRDLSFQAQMSSKLEADKASHRVDYSLIRYQPMQQFDVSIGRLRLDTLFYSGVEAKGITHPWVLTPAEVYSISRFNHYDGMRISGYYMIDSLDIIASVIGGSSANKLSTGSSRVHLGLWGLLLEVKHPLGDVRFSYTSYRTNDPDMFWNEREESDVTFSIKADVMGASFILEYLNHIDSDPSAYVLRSLATYDQADIVENQANNTTDEAIRLELEDLAVQLLEQAEKEAAAADYGGLHATIGYQYLDVFGYLTYAVSNGVIQQAWASHGQQSSFSFGLNYAYEPNIVLKSQVSNISSSSGYKGLFDSPFHESPILENSSDTAELGSGLESIFSFAVNIIF